MTKPNTARFQHAVFILIRFVLGGVFIGAAIPKILDPAAFAAMVYNYQLLPDALINFVAITLPWTEATIGVLLIIGIWLPGAVVMYNALMIFFLTALAFNLWRGLDISCGCFSTDPGETISTATIFRDLSILAGALYLAFVVFIRKINSDREFVRFAKKAAG